jgi:hypothetical protein
MMHSIYLEAIMNYLPDIIITVLVIVLAIIAYVKGYNKVFLNKLTLKFVVEAEIKLGSGTGKYKFNEVMTNIYDKLPFVVRLFISEDYLEKLIEENVEQLTKFLESGGNLSDYTIKTTVSNNKES